MHNEVERYIELFNRWPFLVRNLFILNYLNVLSKTEYMDTLMAR
ncbi:hypothetical protein BOCO_1035 [Bombiscardovia coagulans]|uniref:Uncharacterized protein n=1 Tax=Bombiscardovia coagulans TaxID=686666 RepID=A0A261ERC5_9BIFI|nr:hypothetical protein BOCO_1035 [Bombiscardovia coagulans]